MKTQYDSKETEGKWYNFWQENGFFNAERGKGKGPFSVVIPPPNVTGILHMGHALNNTIQDTLIRYKRMQGYSSLWMPGTDHAGIATQNVVERRLAKDSLRKEDIGREEFVKRLWLWKEEFGSTIINQLKRLGASCDWRRLRFTMDRGYSDAVRKAFVHLYNKGLVYKGNYIINWCPRCKTALSDEEAPHKETDSKLYYLRYPLIPKENTKVKENQLKSYIVVATTRPETMLGDTAVAVNPKDKRYAYLKDYQVILPVMNRKLKVIFDDFVDPDFGTGVVKVTPAHDKNDFYMGKRHNLEFINIMDGDAVLNSFAGEFQGMDRFAARKKLLSYLSENNLLEKEEPYKLSAGYCYRCGTMIEPKLSEQWFVKMKPLSEPALKAVAEGKITFSPERWKKVYLNWMENIEDWCISRQIWWGHRLPVYYCESCRESKINEGIIVSEERPEKCPYCGSDKIVQDEDVLDTWFSSWLWPFASFGWPFKARELKGKGFDKEDLDYFYPTDVLVTGSEILFFWVARMVMSGLEFMRDIPFKDVVIHGTVRDIKGVKMSKSLGNVIDPVDIIEKFGADALRFSLMMLASAGSDVYLSEDKFLLGRNFANKIWNASRYILDVREGSSPDLSSFSEKQLSLSDKWILSELNLLTEGVSSNLDKRGIDDAARQVYDFFRHKFCDWYIEISKIEKSPVKNTLLVFILDNFLRLLHPVMPFITEEIWQKINSKGGKSSIMVSDWPELKNVSFVPKEIPQDFINLRDLVLAVRRFKKDLGLSQKLGVAVFSNNLKALEIVKENKPWIDFLSRSFIEVKGSALKEGFISITTPVYDIGISRKDAPDIGSGKNPVSERINRLSSFISIQEKKLKNSNFTDKAPAKVVEETKSKLKVSLQEKERLEKIKW